MGNIASTTTANEEESERAAPPSSKSINSNGDSETSGVRSFQLKVHLPSSTANSEELQDLLKEYGQVSNVVIYSAPRGTIVVDFEDQEAVEEAVYNFQVSNRYGKNVKAKKQPAVRFTYSSDGRDFKNVIADEISKKHDVLKIKVATVHESMCSQKLVILILCSSAELLLSLRENRVRGREHRKRWDRGVYR